MSYQEYIQVTHQLLSRPHAALHTGQEEIFFTKQEKEWSVVTKIFPSSDIEEIFKNVDTIPLTASGLYLKKNQEGVFLSKQTPLLQRYTFFRRYVREYLLEIKEWKKLLEQHTRPSHTLYS
jgi:hypothetical protein